MTNLIIYCKFSENLWSIFFIFKRNFKILLIITKVCRLSKGYNCVCIYFMIMPRIKKFGLTFVFIHKSISLRRIISSLLFNLIIFFSKLITFVGILFIFKERHFKLQLFSYSNYMFSIVTPLLVFLDFCPFINNVLSILVFIYE